MDLEAVQVSNYLRSHPDFVEEWLSRNADSALLEAVRIKWSKQPKPHSPPITIQRPPQPPNEKEAIPSATDYEEKAGADLDDNDGDEDDIADDNEFSKLDLEAIKKAAEEAVLEDDDLDDTLHVEPSPSSVVPRCGRKSVTSDLFHQWLASGSASNNTRVTSLPSPNNVVASTTLQPNPTEIIDQTDKLIEYILDISNELDINVLVRITVWIFFGRHGFCDSIRTMFFFLVSQDFGEYLSFNQGRS